MNKITKKNVPNICKIVGNGLSIKPLPIGTKILANNFIKSKIFSKTHIKAKVILHFFGNKIDGIEMANKLVENKLA